MILAAVTAAVAVVMAVFVVYGGGGTLALVQVLGVSEFLGLEVYCRC